MIGFLPNTFMKTPAIICSVGTVNFRCVSNPFLGQSSLASCCQCVLIRLMHGSLTDSGSPGSLKVNMTCRWMHRSVRRIGLSDHDAYLISKYTSPRVHDWPLSYASFVRSRTEACSLYHSCRLFPVLGPDWALIY
jgi:hypothetical protein